MFLFSQWLGLTLPQRNALAAQFGIPKKGATHVFSNQIKDDGYQVADIEAAITVDSLQTFLATDETDMAVLWDMLMTRMFMPAAVEAEVPLLIIEPETLRSADHLTEPVAAPDAFAASEVAEVSVAEELPAEAPVEAPVEKPHDAKKKGK